MQENHESAACWGDSSPSFTIARGVCNTPAQDVQKQRLLGLARFVHFARRRRKLQFMIRCPSFAGLVLAILIIGTAPAAWADSIGPTGCVNDSCFGNVFTLEF